MRKDGAHDSPLADVDALTGTLGGSGRATRLAARRLADEQLPVLDRAQQLSQRPEIQARLVACELVTFSSDEDPEEAMAVLHDLAADGDPAVRTAAVAACARITRTHFGRIVEVLSGWRDSPSPHVRRAVVVSAARAAEPTRLER
ncbi:MAG: HEAT repeat domain-containing protein, partial [Candidatus Bipolaricaulota bacterium]|nr:HEAT repeat domain-containing protein [Candidatus Bipolaricaulota bacterium]